MCSLHRNCNRLPGAPDARKRPAMCACAHEQAADKADGVPGERLLSYQFSKARLVADHQAAAAKDDALPR